MKIETATILDSLYSKFDSLFFILDPQGIITEAGGNLEATGYSINEWLNQPLGRFLYRFSKTEPYTVNNFLEHRDTPTLTNVAPCFLKMKEGTQSASQRKITRWTQLNRNWLRGRISWTWTKDMQSCVIVFISAPYMISRYVDENSLSLCAVAGEDGRIIDINENFLIAFNEHGDDLLGMPLERLFILEDFKRVQQALAGKIEDPVNRASYAVRFAGKGKEFEEALIPDADNRLAIVKEGLSVSSDAKLGYLMFKQELESPDDDVRVSFRVRLKPDFSFGLVINGLKNQPVHYVDTNAFLMLVDSKYCTLKYSSIDARKSPIPSVDFTRAVTVTLGRSGSRFIFSLNGKSVEIPYFTISPPSGSGIGLYFRDGMVIDDVKIETRKGLDLSGFNRPNIIRFKKWENRYFALSIHERNYVLNEKSVFYQLSEVTQLKNISQELERLQLQTKQLKKQIFELKTVEPSNSLKSNTPFMSRIYDTIRQIAPTNVTVLLTGETGAGKDVIARTLHRESTRKKGPFIKIDCAALSETILESELFGHEKGAFTGAIEQRTGKFEAAHNGTVYLDDIENLSLKLQTKLLSVINDRKLERLGSNRPVMLDIRIIAATNIDLMDLIAQGKFREDLYYRLNVAHLHLPPLRERLEDLPLIVSDLIKDICRENGIAKPPVLDQEGWDYLFRQKWPGNIRELRNALQFAIIRSGGKVILPDHFYRPRSERNEAPAGSAPSVNAIPIMNPAVVPAEPGSIPDIPKYLLKNMSQREKRILSIIHQEGNATPKWLMDRLSISKATVWKDLVHMTRLKLLTKTGSKRGVKYQTNL